jgi:hypothetical protein
LEMLYEEVLTGARRPLCTTQARERAVARFLHENLPRRPNDARWPWLAEREALTNRLDELQRELANAVRQRDDVVRQHDDVVRKHDDVVRQRDDLLCQSAVLKRSRLLKLGRLLRRIAGSPIPY